MTITTSTPSEQLEPTPFWWQGFNCGRIAPLDYPLPRVIAATERLARGSPRLEAGIDGIRRQSRTADEAVRGIARFVQAALVHPPLLQPATARWGYWRLRRAGLLPAGLAGHEEVRAAMHQRLIMDPELLLELGEARCGQCAAVLCAALQRAGFAARPWQLPHHIAVEVDFDGETRVIDADAFKHGIFFEDGGGLITKRAVEANPYVVDRFKPTGWMFRRDSVYARNPRTGRPYRGYVDFYSPEVDGQISARYAAPTVLRPPGVPRWSGEVGPLTVERGATVSLAFQTQYADRAASYRVRCGRRSRGYAYDRLVLSALAQETASDVFEVACPAPALEFKLAAPGRYYVAAAAIPAYLDEFPSYVWWSDELIIDVI